MTLVRCEWSVSVVDLAICQDLVQKYHYTKGGSNTATFRHGLYDGNGLVRGCAWWIPPTKAAARAIYPEGHWSKVMCLSRLVVDPECPKNSASFLLGRSMKLVLKDDRWECLVTYADTGQGHTGAIYLATNWEFKGLTAPEAQWMNPATKRFVARKAGPKTRTKQDMEDLGFVLAGRFQKRRFRYFKAAKIKPVAAVTHDKQEEEK